jgi:hypothetical protein
VPQAKISIPKHWPFSFFLWCNWDPVEGIGIQAIIPSSVCLPHSICVIDTVSQPASTTTHPWHRVVKSNTHEKKKTNKHNFRSQALTVYCNSDCVKDIGTLSLILSPVCCPCLIYYSDTISQHLLAHACTGCRVGFEMCELVVAECGMAVTSALGPPTFVWAPMASEQLLFFHSLTHLYGYPKKVGWLEEVSVASQQVPPKKKKCTKFWKVDFFQTSSMIEKSPKKSVPHWLFSYSKKWTHRKGTKKSQCHKPRDFFSELCHFFQ